MSKPKISSPLEVKHVVHIDKDMDWQIDPTVPPESIFQKVREIGIGGFGTVSEFIHIQSGIRLAGKAINKDLITPKLLNSLKAEIDIMKTINSPVTIHYYGSIQWGGQTTILMEFCPQGSLRDLIDFRDCVLSENQIAIIMLDTLTALKVLHQHKIIHRDIKAANILLGTNGFCRITDFGVSRQFRNGSVSFSTQTAVGTPYWMAPEVINEEKYSYSADIFSVGATAVELAEGAPPLCELPATRAMVEIATKGFAGLRNPKRFSTEFKEFLSLCTNKDPKKRAKVDDLFKTSFIQRAARLDRNLVLEPLLTCNTDFNALLAMDAEEDNNDEDEFVRSTKSNIKTARKTLRKA